MTSLQRRSVQQIGGVLLLTVIANLSVANPILEWVPGLSSALVRQHASLGLAGALAAFSLLPIVLAAWIAAAYLKEEPDDFIRMLVVRALLWGFVITMAGDAMLGAFTMLHGRPFPISVLNADLFIAGSGLAFRVLQRSYR